jgi:hypothetical protein
VTTFAEGALVFEFGHGWIVEKYDDHPAYRQGIERLRGRAQIDVDGRAHALELGTKAIDFVGLWESEVHFIEVKDFRGHRIENKQRIRNGDLAVEVALKVRDTIAGIVGACQKPGGEPWQPFVEAFAKRGRPRVCLWLEEDTLGRREMKRGHPGIALQQELEDRLSWLAPRVLVRSRAHDSGVAGIAVHSLPDGVVDLRARMRATGQITRDDFCDAFRTTQQDAGQTLKQLCAGRILLEIPETPSTYREGAVWLEWHGDPRGAR